VQLGRKRGEVVQPMQMETIPEQGMPIYHEGHLHEQHEGEEYGKLFVEYTVVLPDQMEKSMEKDFWALFEKWRSKKGVDLFKDSGRPASTSHDEL
jgi:DnaJ-related protein SCJ1